MSDNAIAFRLILKNSCPIIFTYNMGKEFKHSIYMRFSPDSETILIQKFSEPIILGMIKISTGTAWIKINGIPLLHHLTDIVER